MLLLQLLVVGVLLYASQAQKPNIVLVVADDYGYNDVGYHGSEIRTPGLDSLASQGVKLDNYYVQPICTPSRSQLMSGRYQIRTGLQHLVIRPEQPNAMPLDSLTLADKVKEAGYATHMVGKWHLGFYTEKHLPWNRGFDTFYGHLNGAENYWNHTRWYIPYEGGPRFPVEYLDLHTQDGPVSDQAGKYSTHLFTEKTIDVINAHDTEKPMFLYLAYQAVHDPMMVPQEYEDIYKDVQDENRRKYSGMVAAMDEGIANVSKALRDKGMWDNTIFIFSTDNGGDTRWGGNNYPLRGRKVTLWEGGLKGVGFVSGGALNPTRRGTVSNEMLHVSDWFPTLINLAGGNYKGVKPIDGIDQWDMINNGMASKRTELLHNIDPIQGKVGTPLFPAPIFDTSVRAAIRVGSFKLITGDPGPGDWTPVPPLANQKSDQDGVKNVWLFNITADPYERNDLSGALPDVVRDLLAALKKYDDEAVPCRWPEYDPNANPALHGGIWLPWIASGRAPSLSFSGVGYFLLLALGVLVKNVCQ